MEMQQMMELLLARMDANTKANQEDLLAKIEAMDANQAKTDTRLKELKEDIKTNQVKADKNLKERSIINAWIVDMKDG
jgi:hypothetical protein